MKSNLKVYLMCVAITGMVFLTGIYGMWGLWDVVAYLIGAWISWSVVLFVFITMVSRVIGYFIRRD